MPRGNILVIANITPEHIFLRTLNRSLADQDQVKHVCACLVSFSVMFIASLVVSLVVPLPLRICLAFACVMFCCLPCVLVVSYCLQVCLAFSVTEERRGLEGSCVSGAQRWSLGGKLCVSIAGRTGIPR